MPKIISRTGLNVGTEITLDTAGSTFTLNVAGNLNAKDGVTLQALYSKFIDLWTTASYSKFEFPMYVIDAKSGQFIFGFDGGTYSGWKPADNATRQMLRDGGWSEYTAGGVLDRQYVGIVSLGEVNEGAQLYYQKVSGGASSDFTFVDEVNEGILVFENGVSDTRTYFKGFVREPAKKYKDSVLGDTAQTGTGAYIVNMLLSNEDDLDITDNDGVVSVSSPYTAINVKYFPTNFTKDVESATSRNFGVVIDVGTHSGVDGSAPGGASVFTTAAGGMSVNAFAGGSLTVFEGTNKNQAFPIVSNTATALTVTGTVAAGTGLSFVAKPAVPVVATLKQIYTKIQYLLRQATDIDSTAGTVTGKTASLLLNFVGPSLKCGFFIPTNPNGGGSGVIIEGLRDADLNDIVFYDNTATAREYPYSSAGTMQFNAVLVAGATGYYRLYFTDLPGVADYGLSGALLVNDKNGVPIQGTIAAGSISFTFDYTGNTQGGRTGGTDASVTLVAGNAGSAKPVVATGTITQSKSVSITATAEQDRAYIV